MGVWDSFAQGMEIGNAMRSRARDEQRQSDYGAAFKRGGFGEVGNVAGAYGDLETAEGAQDQVAQQEETLQSRATRNATVLSNVATSLLGVPYEQRQQRIQQMAPMLTQMGLPEDQIAGFDPTDEALAQVRALQGQFSQYADIIEQGNQVIGVRPDGSVEVLHTIPAQAPATAADQFSVLTPEEIQAQGLTPGSYQRNARTNEIKPIGRVGSGSTFPADQRARVAVMLDPALEAAQMIDRMEAQAQNRQGTHSSQTPLGQDWGARMLEAIPFDGGSAARAAGGADYNQYVSASRAFEAAMLPILSGAAVTESEAVRVVRAAIPQLNDSPEVLADKARRRRQMLNGAAMIGGRQPPYPEDGAPEWASRAQAATSQAASAGRTLEDLSDEELDALEAQLSQQ